MMFNIWTDLLNTNFFSGLSTILTIGGAIYLFFRQKKEHKQEIAALLLNDIRNANNALQVVRDLFNGPGRNIPDITILPDNNWKKYSYLFSKDFDEDELDEINNYFINTERCSYLVQQHSNLFLQHIFTRMNAMQNANINLLVSNSEDDAKFKISEFDQKFANPNISSSPYDPIGFYTNLEKYLPEIPNILTSSVGIKLKEMAYPKKRTLFLLKK